MADTKELQEQQKLVEQVASGHDADLVSRMLESDFSRRRRAIEQRIFEKVQRGEALGADEAIQAWLQLYAIHDLERHLRQKVQRGEGAARQLHAAMGAEPAPPPKGHRRFLKT